MTIRRGAPWGEPGALADDGVVLDSDAAAADLLGGGPEAGAGPVEVGVVGGDLHRTLGAPRHDEADLRAGRGTRFPVDLGLVDLTRPDGTVERRRFLAHLVAGGARLWSGRTLVVMNASFLGEANLGPRAHPNDGLLDVTEGSLRWTDRRAAARRATTGTHLPHPDLRERRTASYRFESDRPVHVRLDGRDAGTALVLDIRCEPDAAVVVA